MTCGLAWISWVTSKYTTNDKFSLCTVLYRVLLSVLIVLCSSYNSPKHNLPCTIDICYAYAMDRLYNLSGFNLYLWSIQVYAVFDSSAPIIMSIGINVW